MYLDFAYFGHGCYGVESAARFYFDKPARALELGEAALLAGIIASPNNYSPFARPELARARHRTVLGRMARRGFIPANSVERYWREFWRRMESRATTPEVSFWRMRVNEAPYVVEAARRWLEKEYGKERILKGGLSVATTVDLDMQRAAQEALREGLADINRRLSTGTPEGRTPVEGGLVALDPASGEVLAFAGGSGFRYSNQLDRAADIRRPIGSSVKPFIYAVAFASAGFRPDDRMLDEPLRLRMGGGRWWSPRNYGDKHYGEVTLSTALAKSINTVAVQLLRKVELRDVTSLLAGASGAESRRFPRNLSLALGTADLSPMELAAAYALFANGGRAVRPFWLGRVEGRGGAVLREAQPAVPVAVLDPAAAASVREALRGVLEEGGTAYEAARRTGFNLPAAGKTGTTDDYRDAWFAGVTPGLAAAVWLGHDDMRVPLGPGGTGGGLAAPVWMRFVKEVHRLRPAREFE